MMKARGRLDFVVPPRVARRRRKRVAASPRLGLLAPRLSALTGNWKNANGRAIGAGIRAAVIGGFDPEDPGMRLKRTGAWEIGGFPCGAFENGRTGSRTP
jgi:hypothetical protein